MARRSAAEAAAPTRDDRPGVAHRDDRERIFDAFRRWGYYGANLDPLGFFAPQAHPELALTGEAADEARRYYCGTIGADFMHLPEPERRGWSAPTSSSRFCRRAILAASGFRWKA